MKQPTKITLETRDGDIEMENGEKYKKRLLYLLRKLEVISKDKYRGDELYKWELLVAMIRYEV